MSENVYQAPKSGLIEDSEQRGTQFYVVSQAKLSVLYLATLGMYGVYWFYAHWRHHRDYTGEKNLPVMRGIFNIFFTHSLFAEIDFRLRDQRLEYSWSPYLLATFFVVTTIAGNVLDQLSYNEIGSPMTDVFSLLTLPVLLSILLKAQNAANLSQGDEHGERNSHFTVFNYLWLVPGMLLWALLVIGLLDLFGLL